MAFKKNGTKVAKIMLATAVATSVVSVTNLADAASQKEAENLVKKAEKLAASLQKEVTYESRVKLYPKDKLGLPSMKLYKDTEIALKKAQKEITKLKGNSKNKLQIRLASKVEKPYRNATTYINVVNAAKELSKTNKTLDRYLSEGKIYTSVIKLHTLFNKNVKDFTQSISKVSGAKTKQVLRDTYIKKFNKTNQTASYAITIKNEIAQLNMYVTAGEDEKATELQKTIEARLSQGKKLDYIKRTLAKSYDSSLSKVTKEIDKKYAYIAQSGDSVNPTTYGGTKDEAKVINHDLVVVAGKDQYIKVANVEVNGNVVIKGDKTGAGTVTFDNVKVHAVGGKGGEIIVEDVADHSFYISNVTADKLSIKDINGGNIIAQEGTKIQELAVVDKAGETGKINLVSTKGSFEQVNVASTGGKTEVAFNGDFSESKIEVKAPAAQVTLAKDVVIKALDIKSEAKINAQEGAKVETINLAVEQKGQKVEFSGALKDVTVNIANANVNVEVAKDTVIKEIAKDKDVTGDVAITNNGQIDTVTDVKVETPTPAPAPSPTPTQSSPSDSNSGSGSTSTSTIENSTLSSSTATFDKKAVAQANVSVTMTLNGNTLSSIKNGTVTLTRGTDYTISGSTVTLKKEYLASQIVGKTTLTFQFSAGDSRALAITISDTSDYPAPSMHVIVNKGFGLGTTSIIYPTPSENSLAIKVADSSVSTPNIGTVPPSDVSTYESEDDISNVNPGQFVQIYELDSTKKVVQFDQVQITSDQLQSSKSARFITTPNPLTSLKVEFNSPLNNTVFSNTKVDDIFEWFQITNEETSNNVNETSINTIQWDNSTNSSLPKLIINLKNGVTLSENYLMELGFKQDIIQWDVQGQYEMGTSKVSGDISISQIIEHIKQIASNTAAVSRVDSVSNWLNNLSLKGKIKNFDSNKAFLYHKEIAENRDIITNLTSLQDVIDKANKFPIFDSVQVLSTGTDANVIRLKFSEDVWFDNLVNGTDIVVSLGNQTRKITNVGSRLIDNKSNTLDITVDGAALVDGEPVVVWITDTGALKIKDADNNPIAPVTKTVSYNKQTAPSADQEAVNRVAASIEVLPVVENLTLANETQVNEATTAFYGLTPTQRVWVSAANQSKLTEAVAKLTQLREQALATDINDVKAKIEALTLNDVTQVETNLPSIADNKGTTIDWKVKDSSNNPIPGVSVSNGKIVVDNSNAAVQVTGAKLIATIAKDNGIEASAELTFNIDVAKANTTPIEFYPNYSAGFIANENMLTINVQGNLTGPINTGKIKYMTSETGETNLTLSGEYNKVDYKTDLKPGEYYYLSSGSDTVVYLKLTENDANAIKDLEGYGNDSYSINENNDRIVAESGWYPNAVTGTKSVSIYNEISVTNNSTKEIASTYKFDKNEKEIDASGTSPGIKPGETFNIIVNSQATKIVFYEGEYKPNVTPTNGKMKIIQVDENTLNGITLDDSNWINVNDTNFGKSEVGDQTTADQQAADVVINKITALPTEITLANEPAVKDAQTAFDGLTDAQKELVRNESQIKLNDALAKIAELSNQASTKSKVLLVGQIRVENSTSVSVTDLNPGDIVKLYSGDTLIGQETVASDFSFCTITGLNLSEKGEVGVTVTHPGKSESDKVSKPYNITPVSSIDGAGITFETFTLNEINDLRLKEYGAFWGHISGGLKVTVSNEAIAETVSNFSKIGVLGSTDKHDSFNADSLATIEGEVLETKDSSGKTVFKWYMSPPLSGDYNWYTVIFYDENNVPIGYYQHNINIPFHETDPNLIADQIDKLRVEPGTTAGTTKVTEMHEENAASYRYKVFSKEELNNMPASLNEGETAVDAGVENWAELQAPMDDITADDGSKLAVVALNSEEKVMAYSTKDLVSGVNISEHPAPTMDIKVEKGFVFGTTSISYTPALDNTLAIKVSNQSVPAPIIGTEAPTDVVDYESGDDIANVSAGKFVQIYELDANNKVVKFQQVQLKSEQLQSESDFRFVLESNSFDSIAIEFNKALEESVYSKTNVDDVIKLFQITTEDSANSFNRSNIDNIKWDKTTNPNQPKLIIKFKSNVTLSENYVMELGFVEDAVPMDVDFYAYEVNETSGENLTPLIIKHIKQIAGSTEDSNLAHLVSDWLESLSTEGKIQNYDSSKKYSYQKEIAENTVTDLASLQVVIDKANQSASTSDVTPPIIDEAYFGISNITNNSVNLNVKVDEDATGYYVLVPFDAGTPSLEQVKKGMDSSNHIGFLHGSFPLSANLPNTVTINGLAVAMQYKLVMFAEDSHGNATDLKNVLVPMLPILPPPVIGGMPPVTGLPPAPGVITADDVNNVLVGVIDGMEYSTDGGQTWVLYNSTNKPKFEGNQAVDVRSAAASTVTHLNFTKSVDLPPMSPYKLIADDALDTIIGLDTTMEYNLGTTENWTKYDGTNLPDLSGDKTISVRYSETAVKNYSLPIVLDFSNKGFVLGNDDKNGIPTNTLTYVWNTGHIDDVTFSTLLSKSILDLFAPELDVVNVLGAEDVKIDKVTWENSGDQLKSTFTLAKPINMKDTLGLSIKFIGMDELNQWEPNSYYSALYKATDNDLLDLLLKEVNSPEINSISNIEEILNDMSMREPNSAVQTTKEKLINYYNPSLSVQYLTELETSASNIHSISDLQNVINKVNQAVTIK